MTYKILFFKLIFVLSIGQSLFAELKKQENSCPDWLMNRSPNIPTCPEGGGTLVPETYPAGAVVISDNGMAGHDSGFTVDVVKKVLIAAGNNNPLLILPVSDDTIEVVKAGIDQMAISQDLKIKYKKSILQVPTQGYTWQQDYMQPFINPTTGQIVLREVQGYGRHGDSFEKIIDATKSCGFQLGQQLSTGGSFLSSGGYMGGNIETLPFGICLLGNDHLSGEQWENYANQICDKGSENRIKTPTAWLGVGHTDEIMKVVRNNNIKAPCNFSIVLASPRKAIEIMKNNPNEPFLDFSNTRGNISSTLMKRRSAENHGLRTLCLKHIHHRNRPHPNENKDAKPDGGTSKIFDIKSILIEKAFAAAWEANSRVESEDCSNLTNGEVYQLLTSDTQLKVYNQLVQNEMDSLKAEVSQKLKNKAPQCEPDFIEAPDIFFGGTPVEKEKGIYELPTRMGNSVLPNPTNAISISDTIISPDPSNIKFKKYMEEEYKKRGLKSEFVDTFDYAHNGQGNLHCSTNTIHVCNPRGRR